MYTARRIAVRFFEYIGEDEHTPGDTFNSDAMPHSVDDVIITFDSVAELVNAMRLDGAESRIDWDRPVGYSHAVNVLGILDRSRKTRDN